MTAQQQQPVEDTMLVGPTVEDVATGLWAYVVLRGRAANDDSAHADCITGTSLWLVEASRDALLASMRHATWLQRLDEFADEYELAVAGAKLWPRKFASLVALAETKLAGGGIA